MTPQETRALDFIRDHIERLGFSPSYREIASALGLASTHPVHDVVHSLIDQGKLRQSSRRTRNLELVGDVDLRGVPLGRIQAELGRRGLSLDALRAPERVNRSRGAVTCAVDGCSVEVRPGMLMCRTHWFRVPASMQHAIKLAYGARDIDRYGLLVSEARDIAAIEARS